MSFVSGFLLASSAIAALQAALDSQADWTMTRRLDGSDRVLVSSGTVLCTAGQGIVWETTAPFAASVAMTTNAMVFVDEDGRREKSLDELPHYAEIRAATDAFVAGRTNAFDGVFDIRETTCADGGWRLTLVPTVAAMRRLVTKVELSGMSLPTNAVLRAPGSVSVIRFQRRNAGVQ